MIVIAVIAAGIAAAGPPTAVDSAPGAPPATVAAPPPVAPFTLGIQPATTTVTPLLPIQPPVDPAVAIRDAFRDAQSLQGRLDGSWRLDDASGHPLLIFQLSDPGAAISDASPGLEGAWRDPNRTGAIDSSGFLDQVDRHGDGLSIRLREHGDAQPVVISLHAAGPEWRGELSDDGARRRVVMDPF